jgi:hypothetical protein
MVSCAVLIINNERRFGKLLTLTVALLHHFMQIKITYLQVVRMVPLEFGHDRPESF